MSAKSICSLQHPLVKKVCKLRTDNKYRKQENLIVITKDAIIQEINHLLKIEILLHLENSPLINQLNCKEKICVTPGILHKCAGYESQDSCLALFKIPSNPNNFPFPWLVLDGIQDPGNVGNLMRSALAFNFKTVIFLENCCDPYSDKALKASRGSIFHLEIHSLATDEFLKLSESKNSKILFADAKGKDISSFSYPTNLSLILGNEGHGVSKKIQDSGKSIAIKMNTLSESLNVAVAGSVIMYQVFQGTHE